ncbi:LuxR C-terminal-related transcriptional regulator [Lentzea sp. CC55]|uniref:LuxR C-terminal-related transcriptional regulator n=1 Tax=Lentzea sp. CC55 TaxID=2884909 RepID=UPI001F2DC209|nr:LuxR C-terminal-related transcriptional regulator [Lentzea sp. CC55]MCG8926940.1 LuxR C-terminal-related transcriptional regulator [Lentzea sp. CC55]
MARFVVEMVFETTDERLAEVRPAHRRYWEDLAVRGVLLGGGLYADESGGLMLCEAADDDALRRLVDGDPYVQRKLVRSVKVREWHVLVGGLTLSSGRDPEPQQLGLTMASSEISGSLISRIESGPRITRAAVADGRALTAHEHRIAALIVGGKTNREIAHQFRVSVRAVELHITSIYRKLGINRRAQLASALAA